MNKNISKKAFYTVISLALLVSIGSIAFAAYEVPNQTAEKVFIIEGNYIEAPLPDGLYPEGDLTVGAFPGPDVYEEIRLHGGYKGASLNIPIRYPSTTSTAMTDLILGTHYFAEDVFLSDWGWAITEQNDDSGFDSFQIGTTTLTSGSRFEPGVSSLTNSTTDTLVASSQIVTSTDDVVLDIWGYADQIFGGTGLEGNKVTSTPGTFFDSLSEATFRKSTTSPVFIPAGTLLVISCSGDCQASSSDALITGDAPNFKGMFYGDIIYQEQN